MCMKILLSTHSCHILVLKRNTEEKEGGKLRGPWTNNVHKHVASQFISPGGRPLHHRILGL